jgi:hypothetical protein
LIRPPGCRLNDRFTVTCEGVALDRGGTRVLEVHAPRSAAAGELYVGQSRQSVLGLRVRVKVTIDVSVRWGVVIGASAVYHCLKLMEALMNSFTSVVLFGAALMPVSG